MPAFMCWIGKCSTYCREISLEKLLTDNLAEKEQLTTYKHKGFWTPVETYRDRVNMENLWNAGIAPWAG